MIRAAWWSLWVVACHHGPPSAGGPTYDELVEQGRRDVEAERLAEAERAFDLALRARPDGIEARYGRALVDARTCFTRHERCESCVTRFDEVIAEKPWRYSYYNRGNCLLDLGRLEPALADLDRAVDQDPRDVDALVTRGSARLRQGDVEGACADLGAARRLGWAPPALPPACAVPDAGGIRGPSEDR